MQPPTLSGRTREQQERGEEQEPGDGGLQDWEDVEAELGECERERKEGQREGDDKHQEDTGDGWDQANIQHSV